MKVFFNKINYKIEDLEKIISSLNNEIGGVNYSNLVSSILEEKLRVKKVLTTTSCSHALEMACRLGGIKEGDQVIMPSFTFPSTANSVLSLKGKPVFSEIEEETLNIDTSKIEEKINEKTKAIIPVHYGGISCDMDKIIKLGKKYNLIVIEDGAQALGGMYKEKYLNTIGDFGCTSFHQSKNFYSGEGGALFIKDENMGRKSQILRQNGTNRDDFINGIVNNYNWVNFGSSYLPSEILMAYLIPQLQNMEKIINGRRKIWEYYHREIGDNLRDKVVSFSKIPEYSKSNYHIFYIILKENKRDEVILRLKEKGVEATFHYLPLHSSPMGLKLGNIEKDFPITNKISSSLIRLPLYNNMEMSAAEYVIKSLKEVL